LLKRRNCITVKGVPQVTFESRFFLTSDRNRMMPTHFCGFVHNVDKPFEVS
jgi:hypothetical protein